MKMRIIESSIESEKKGEYLLDSNIVLFLLCFVLFSSLPPGAGLCWSYKDWSPGGERKTFDGVTFDSTIHCGNGHDFQKTGPNHYGFRARVGNALYAWRYYFRIESPGDGRKIILEVFDLDHAGRTPWNERATVYSYDGQEWNDVGEENITVVDWTPTGNAEEDGKYGDKSHIPYGVRFTVTLDRPVMWFASPTPYTLQDQDDFFEKITKEHPEFVKLKDLGETYHTDRTGYGIRSAEITDFSIPSDEKTRCFVIAGEHPAESAGIYACIGMMEKLLSSPELLRGFDFHFVPLANPDGIYYGRTYHNLILDKDDLVGYNVLDDWNEIKHPEAMHISARVREVQPRFFLSLHNGRGRHSYDLWISRDYMDSELIARMRAALSVKINGVNPAEDRKFYTSLKDQVPIIMLIETLLLDTNPGSLTHKESYLKTGAELLVGMTNGLNEDIMNKVAMIFNGQDFAVQLPWFYYYDDFSTKREHNIWSFEINALDIEPGKYNLRFRVPKGVDEIELSWDGANFTKYETGDSDYFDIRGREINNRMVSVHLRASGYPNGMPLTEVLLTNGDPDSVTPKAFNLYKRNTEIQERHILDNWQESYQFITSPAFGVDDLKGMFAELSLWAASKQVLDTKDPHYGAIYSEEDKYDFRDSAATSVIFMQMYRDTGDREWYDRAYLAKEYTYKGQDMRENPGKYGGFVHMISGKWGTDFRRITDPWPGVDGAETCIIPNLLCKTFELGMEFGAKDAEVLRRTATWVIENEIKPGNFRHHEGATHDCQASNALAASALARIYYFLKERGYEAPEKWLAGAKRGIAHYIEGQEAIGEWPYVFATVGRAQAYSERSLPDQGMGLYHFLVACQEPELRKEFQPEIDRILLRAARWYLMVSYMDEAAPGRTLNLEYDKRGGSGLLFSSFTWCRFMATASIARIWQLTGEEQPWQPFALRLMEHIHTKLWNTTDDSKPPVIRSSVPEIELHSWIQTTEWDAVLLHEIICALSEYKRR